MANDLQKLLDDKIRKLQTLRDLADDPEMVEVLRALANANGNGHKSETEASLKVWVPSPATRRTPRGFQKKKVLEVLESVSEPVTTDWIADQMHADGFEFKAASPPIAVNEALRTLVDEGKARVDHTEGVRNFWLPIQIKQESR